MNGGLLNVGMAADHLGVARKTLYKWVHLRQIQHVRVGRLVRFRMKDLEAWVEERVLVPVVPREGFGGRRAWGGMKSKGAASPEKGR